MKELKFICVQPDDTYYTWQVHLWLESLKRIGHSDKAIILVFTPKERPKLNPKWKQVADLYPEAEFAYYRDEHNLSIRIRTYIPVLRPYTLRRYFADNPSMKDKAIFYCDSDTLFLENFDVSEFVDDDINYLSDTNSYINAKYFDSKVRDVLPEKLEQYKKRDILTELATKIGVTREICEANNAHSGGAQYLLKNVDAAYWNKVMSDCITIRSYLMQINRIFFASENKGFQSWCADMWAVLWNLWLRDGETKVVKEMNFAWATDPIARMEHCTIFHNAGVASKEQNGRPYFYKAIYQGGKNPLKDPHLKKVAEHEVSKNYGTGFYAQKILDLYEQYKLEY